MAEVWNWFLFCRYKFIRSWIWEVKVSPSIVVVCELTEEEVIILLLIMFNIYLNETCAVGTARRDGVVVVEVLASIFCNEAVAVWIPFNKTVFGLIC